MLNCDRLAMD